MKPSDTSADTYIKGLVVPSAVHWQIGWRQIPQEAYEACRMQKSGPRHNRMNVCMQAQEFKLADSNWCDYNGCKLYSVRLKAQMQIVSDFSIRLGAGKLGERCVFLQGNNADKVRTMLTGFSLQAEHMNLT